MSAPDSQKSREVKELLQQLKELHAPDRCEGVGNFFWHGIQRFTHMGSKTDQQKIEDHWKETKDITIHQNDLKKLASKSLRDFHLVCREVNKTVQLASTQEDMDMFIDNCKEEQVQQMFDIMIVQWVWRTRMLEAWDIH